nr:hypothetical protein [Tanacetum cinerariifolium]
MKMEILLESTSYKLMIGREEESFDPIPRTPKDNKDDDNNVEDQGLRIGEEEEADELYRDVDINQGWGLKVSQETEDSHVILSPTQSDAQQESSSTSSFMTNLLNPIIDPDRVKSLEDNFSNIPGIVNQYMHQKMPKAVKSQVQAQVTRILPRIEESVNAQLEAEVLTRSSHSSRTSYVVAADLLEMELKKIVIDKMEGNKSIQRSDEQRNLYKSLIEAYDADKTILESYGESVILKRRREEDDQEGPSAGSDRGSKRQREGGEHASASNPSEPAIGSAGRSTTGSQSRQLFASESAFAKGPVQTTYQMEEPLNPVFETGVEDQHIIQTTQNPEWISQPRRPPTPDRNWNKSVPAAQGNAQSWISAVAKQTDARSLFNELLDTPIDFSNFIMNRLGVDTLTLELLAVPTYKLMRGSCDLIRKYTTSITKTKAAYYGHIKWIEDLVPRAMWIQEPISYDKHALWGVSHWGRKHQQFYGFAFNRESALDVYSKRRIIATTELKIVKWHNYKHLDWISVRRDDDKIYKFKEGDLKRLRIQDIEDMLLLLVQGKLSNLTVEERFVFNVSLIIFTRSIVIQRRVEDLYDGTLNDVRNVLDDRLKEIRMQYLPTTIWRRGDKDRAAAMIQAIEDA